MHADSLSSGRKDALIVSSAAAACIQDYLDRRPEPRSEQ